MKLNFTQLALSALFPMVAFGQTFVNTQPENKKIILEEFTGINCPYCPSGHEIARQIMDNHPGNAFVINIHQGGFATPSGSQPDFRTPFGNAIVNQSYSGTGFGYPSATVNRHVFPGYEMSNSGTTAMGRGQWAAAANQIVAQSSYVNAAVQATIDASTRVMTVNVEVYYTGTSPVSTNKLNVALLQNNTLGPQASGGMGNNYVHTHRLVHLVTDQWGDEISPTTTGSFIPKTYTYTIPESYNDIDAVMGDFELVVFVSEGNQEIISGNGVIPTYVNVQYDNDASIEKIEPISPQCAGEVKPIIEIKNNGNDTLTSLEITYSINGGTAQTYNWTGELNVFEKETLELPAIPYSGETNDLTVSIPSDESNANNSQTVTFTEARQGSSTLSMELRTDSYGSETSWDILDSAGSVVQMGSGYGNNQTYFIDLTLPADCYTFRLKDSYGDGGARVTIKDHNNTNVVSIPGNSYSSLGLSNFSTDGTMGVDDVNLANAQIYPNPSNGIINIALTKAAKIEIFDVTGRSVYAGNANAGDNTINLTGKGKGTFVVKITEGNNRVSKKVIIK